MTVRALNIGLIDSVPDDALTRLQQWALERPLRVALRHRRRGAWKAWRWIDVLHEVERAADALRVRGFGAGSRLALSGSFEPTLLILALAARLAGGQTLLVSRFATGEELRRTLLLSRPEFAFVQRRESVSHWLGAATSPLTLQLFTGQSAARVTDSVQVVPLALLLGDRLEVPQPLGWRHAAREESVWVDEGSEWAQGLELLFKHWLGQGQSFAFPETSESALRDRRDIAPAALLLSESRLQALAGEIESRLAPQGSWRRALCDWTLSDSRSGVRRWVKARVRALLGFSRLRSILRSAPPLLAEQPRQGWIREYLETAA